MSHEQKVAFQGRRFQVVEVPRQLPSGETLTYDVIRHPGAVVILPILDDGSVCLIENYRIAVGETLVELPAGTLEPNEDPAETARRELIEETGFRASTIRKLSEFYMSPGILNERMHLYLATGLEAGETALESGEEIETRIVAWQEAMQMVEAGQVRDAKSLVGLLHYDRLRR